MGTIRCAAAAALAICFAGGPAWAEDKKEPGTADKLVGTWVVTKAPAGLGNIQKGSTLEFKKDGALVIEFKPGVGVEGTYTVDGETIEVKDKAGRMTWPIKTLTRDKLAFGGRDTVECERKAK
jgi:uncharacterized protein (TIGR03066 family)